MKKRLLICVSAITLLAVTSKKIQAQSTTVTFRPGPSNGQDAFINSNFPSTNAANNQNIHSAAWTWSGSFGAIRSFLAFDLSSIPTNATIVDAKLSLYNDPNNNTFLTNGAHSTSSRSNASFLSRVVGAWSDSTLTWSNQPAYDTTNQAILAQSRSDNQDYLNINVDSMVQYMVANPSQNHGFVLRLQTEINYAALIFGASDNIDSTIRPKLEITYMSTVGINELTSNSDIPALFPNPAAQEVNLKFNTYQEELTIELVNLSGQLVQRYEQKGTDQVQLQLDVPSGVYFLRIHRPLKAIETLKFIKN